ncbi:MAG: beta-ketoacyl-[acyl-carrier-protein] synthase family protein [Halobacteriovoraceae bacterium]|nr:beta-ketoacyl-[acyl-carrier-protein] synthase family protein [Halobacteriovoraceae bacterium]
MNKRIVITGIGLTAPNGNNLKDFRHSLLNNNSGISNTEVRHMGTHAAGLCDFDEFKYQKRKMRKRGTRAGAIAIYCANEALLDANIEFSMVDKSRVGVYLGITEHGNVETENEIHELYQNDLKTEFWSHHHNPRTVANSPAGEVTLNLQITGPHCTIGAACAAGNMGLIHAYQMLQLEEVDLALAGGISESPQTFGIFAAFDAQGALARNENPKNASRPLDIDRNGIVISEGGAIYVLETLDSALDRNAKIYGEIIGYHNNSDASDFVLPNKDRQVECIYKALKKAGLEPNDIDIVSMHATGTKAGDIQEVLAVREVFNDSPNTCINATKGFIGHAMGAAGALELAGNLPSFEDGYVHPCMNIDHLDPECEISGLVVKEKLRKNVEIILNNSFGMLGINSVVIVKKFSEI